MTPDDNLRAKLRRLLDEKIPAGKTDADTRFPDADIDDLLTESPNMYAAASAGWVQKAGMYQGECSNIEETSTGNERIKLTTLKAQAEYAMIMADRYGNMSVTGGGIIDGGLILKMAPPEVL